MLKAACVFLLPALAAAAVWPETIGAWRRVSVQPAAISDRPVWDEFGFKEAETATFENGGKSFTATGYRLQDPTGAMAAFQWQVPAKSTPSKLTALAVETAKGFLAAHGNFLFSFPDYRPPNEEVVALVAGLRNLDTSSLPSLPGFLPAQDLVPGSLRYVLGPASLEKFLPGIPPSVAAFSLGAEAQIGDFKTAHGSQRLAIFNYPTPQMAMVKVSEFQKLTGVVAKRTGPLVGVVVAPADADAAERLLSLVRWAAQITFSERMPTRKDNIGDLIINAFILIGILLSFSLVAGLAFGGFRAIRNLTRKGPEPEALISLHL